MPQDRRSERPRGWFRIQNTQYDELNWSRWVPEPERPQNMWKTANRKTTKKQNDNAKEAFRSFLHFLLIFGLMVASSCSAFFTWEAHYIACPLVLLILPWLNRGPYQYYGIMFWYVFGRFSSPRQWNNPQPPQYTQKNALSSLSENQTFEIVRRI